ncbi:MAG: hypothetical protein F4X34_00185 [Chloroflexi bacterium]|nr:hypothetical protein [Chloroflexota bacterium]
MNKGRAVWSILTTVGDEDGATPVAGGGVASVNDADPLTGSLEVVWFTLRLRDALCWESLAVAGTDSIVTDGIAVGTCSWLTSM